MARHSHTVREKTRLLFWRLFKLEQFALEIVARRRTKPASAPISRALPRFASPEHFIGIDIFNNKTL
jgi:hypothetical protein